MANIHDTLFAPNGALASALKDYRPRAGQLALSQAIHENFKANGVLLAEAGTGTGKTFAYLLPALASADKVLISTATKNLQEQIFMHDLPIAKKALQSPAKVALLKGRRNYFCHHHYEQMLQHPAQTKLEQAQRAELLHFLNTTRDGDLVGLSGIGEEAEILRSITSTADNCLGRECDFYEQCFLQKARLRAKEADVIVVNHHLLLADLALRNEGFAEILPEVSDFIIDEAHHLPETAIHFLGKRLSVRQLAGLLGDVQDARLQEAPDALDLNESVAQALKSTHDCLLTVHTKEEARLLEAKLEQAEDFWQALAGVLEKFQQVFERLAKTRERGKLLASVYERVGKVCEELQWFLHQRVYLTPAKALARAQVLPEQAPADKEIEEEKTTSEEVENGGGRTIHAVWLETSARNFTLCAAPVNASGQMAGWIRRSDASWTFLSATLAVDGKFEHFARQLGVFDYSSIVLGSPFDYRKQALLYHPEGLPSVKSEEYTQALMQAMLPVLARSGGRAFLLFTSYRAMNEAAQFLKAQTKDYALFVQGQAPKARLLEEFRVARRAVLLATASFWEGVDVRGQALVCVMIDKLPFSAPSDPVAKMRHELLQQKGLSPFMHDSLPQAVIALKQGVGRLIRGEQDYGVLVIGDPRLRQMGYGKIFLESLPAMTRTTKLAVIERFFAFHEKA